MSFELTLSTSDARLVYLALSYHLARPGAEVDPQTLELQEHGLLEVAQALQPQLNEPVVNIGMSPHQMQRLGQAMLGTVNELKAYPMLAAQGRQGPVSAVPGWDEMLSTLFPESLDDPNVALDLAESIMMLRRRLDSAIAAVAEPESADGQETGSPGPPSRRWQFWRRS
jgi:hypothetical protein